MDSPDLIERIATSNAQKIRARREELGWSQAKLAELAGTSQQTVDRIERGKVHHSRAFDSIWIALDLPPLIRTHLGSRSTGAPANVEGKAAEAKQTDTSGLMPVFGMLSGPIGITDKPVDFIERPPPLRNVVDAYALLVGDPDMSPAFRLGDLALVNPWLHPRLDDDVVVLANYPDRRRAEMGIFAGFDDDEWRIQKPGHPGTIACPRSEWPICHVIMGRYTHT